MEFNSILNRLGSLILIFLLAVLFFPVFCQPGYAHDVAPARLSFNEPSTGSNQLPDIPIVFVSRNRMPNWHRVHVGPPVDVPGRELTPGGRLLLWKPDGSVTNLTKHTNLYDVQQPDVSFDATKVVFSAVTEAGGQWHLWEINLDGTGLRQLTFDDRVFPIPEDPLFPERNEKIFGRYGDFSPACLPDGRIVFVSTRYMTLSGSCGERGQNLYVLYPETGDIYRRTTERAGAIDPFVLADGKIVFSHWIDATNTPSLDGVGLRPLEEDYNFAPSLWGIWVMNPDASDAERYAFLHGGLKDGGGAYQPREFPNGSLAVTFRGAGSLLGDTLANAVTRILPGPAEPHRLIFLGNPFELEGPHALGPAPLPDGRIVVSYTPTSTIETDPQGRRIAHFDFGIYIADETLGMVTPLYNEDDTDELDAAIVIERSAPIIPDGPDSDFITDDPATDLGTTAIMINHGVYNNVPLNVVELPSPRVGTVARIDIYDDSQTFTTSEEFPLIRRQMPRLVASAPVDESGAFTVEVPADKPLLFVLVNKDGVAVRSPLSLKRPDGAGRWITHSFNGHDYLRPGHQIHCAGCHKGHMFQPELAMEAETNLSRIAIATASDKFRPFFSGAWRINDLRLSTKRGGYAWVSNSGSGSWVQLDWPMIIEATKILLYPFSNRDSLVISATLDLSDGTSVPVGPLPEDDSPLEVHFDEPHNITWARFTVNHGKSPVVGLAEMVVNGPPDNARLPNIPPPIPVNLRTTDGVLVLQWDKNGERHDDPNVAGFKIYYGTASTEYTNSIDVGNVTRFIMRDLLDDGVTYFMAVKSYNIYGTESEGYSNEVNATVHDPAVSSIEPDHGPIGGETFITIKGNNFAPSRVRVMLGKKHAHNIKVVDEETITAITHWHAPGLVDVEVSNPDDQTGILHNGFEYVKP